MARGTELYGLDDSPAATATSSTPPKEYKAKTRLEEKAEKPPMKAWPFLKFDKPSIKDLVEKKNYQLNNE